jgi:hypothetical protein
VNETQENMMEKARETFPRAYDDLGYVQKFTSLLLLDLVAFCLYLYGASARATAAISGSHLSPEHC